MTQSFALPRIAAHAPYPHDRMKQDRLVFTGSPAEVREYLTAQGIQ